MHHFWPAFVVVVLFLITWGPTLVTFARLRGRGFSPPVWKLASALALEVLAVVGLALGAHLYGFSNPGGYLLVLALLTGAAGAQLFSRHVARAAMTVRQG